MKRCAVAVCLLFLLVAPSQALWGKGRKNKDADDTVAAGSPDVYWYNEVTKESVWEVPQYEHKDDEGNTYYVDPKSGETTWEKPDELAWAAHDSDEGTYYHNENTGESQWEKPTMLAWEMVKPEHSEL